MGKKDQKLADLRREDVTENNWEVPEKEQETKTEEQVHDTVQIPEPVHPETEKEPSPGFAGVKWDALKGIEKLEAYADGASLLGFAAAVINICREKVDPEITAGNPVEHWAVADDHCTFVFRDGRKVRVSL